MTNLYWKKFPINTATACQSKWTWSTIWLNEGTSSSCHRVQAFPIDPNNFSNFHNLPQKIEDRERMLKGEWPRLNRGCDYCKKIEDSGGFSDRMHNNNLGGYTPTELFENINATHVSPKIVEIFAHNTCNLACIYCNEKLSSKIEAENKKFNINQKISKNDNLDKMYNDFLAWLEENIQNLKRLHLLGGETFIQHDLLQKVFEIIERKPNNQLQLNIFSNFNAPSKYFYTYFNKIKDYAKSKNIGRFDLTCSIDCWGPEQEYVRSGLNLSLLEEYMNYVIEEDEKWLYLNINQTITSMTIKTMPELLKKIKNYKMKRQIGHYFELVIGKPNQHPKIFNWSLWEEDFNNILKLIEGNDYNSKETFERMLGLKKMLESNCKQNDVLIQSLHRYLDQLDYRRETDWRSLFPYLIV
jgi:organic radical activating enzyme